MATLTIADLDNGKRDLQTVDAVANSPEEATTTRYGDSVLTLTGALRRLGYQAPVAYASGLAVDTGLFTVSYGTPSVIYAPDPALVPFTTGAWDPSQWRVIQNTANSNQLYQFPTPGAADAAATTLPEGSSVIVEGVSQGHIVAGAYVPTSGVPPETLDDYQDFATYSGKGSLFLIRDPKKCGLFSVIPGDYTTPSDGGIIFILADGRRVRRIYNGAVSPAWFDAKGDGATLDRTAFLLMLAAVGTTNVTIDLGGLDYFLGEVSETSGPIFDIVGASGFTIKNPGKFFVTNSFTLSDTDVNWAAVFRFRDSEGLDVDVEVEGSAFNNLYPKGVTAVEVMTSISSTKVRGYKIRSRLTNGVSAIEFNRHYTELTAPLPQGSAYARDIVVDAGSKNTEYGLRCVANARDLHGVVNTDGAVRSYFATDTRSHQVRVNSSNHSNFTDVLVKSYFADVRDIHVDYVARGFIGGDSVLTLEFQNDAQNTSITDIHASVTADGYGGKEPVIISRQISSSGNILPTTNSRTDNIFLTVSCPQTYTRDTVLVSSKASRGGSVYFSGPLALNNSTNGLTFVRGDVLSCINSGSFSSGGGSLRFSLGGLQVIQAAFFELEIYAEANPTDSSTSEVYQKWTGRIAITDTGSGTALDLVKQTERLFNTTVSPTVAAVSFENQDVAFTVSSTDFNIATARVYGKLRVLTRSV